ncbi:hypothetical protein PAER4782_34020 (plasmid) [Pseudomonas aeruginosa]|nr:hypothetical protein PAER4782_34020 [Pseudomonas aeruginosa]CAI9912104.1 hypothetical protein PAER4782_34020 [Pseudomonas aeruginosa]
MAKHCCENAGLQGHYSSHTLRKAWDCHQRKIFDTSTNLLASAKGHGSEWRTLEYLCIHPEQTEEFYGLVL